MTTIKTRKTHHIDAAGRTVGRIATEIAVLLMGKDQPEHDRRTDMGGVVEVANIREMKFTGKKLTDKVYHRFTGYPGGIKTISLEKQMAKDPSRVLENAVVHMLPHNHTTKKLMKRLIIR